MGSAHADASSSYDGRESRQAELERRVEEKETQLRELRHRVKNNLQLITALIRAEARSTDDQASGEGYKRLAGRVEALGVLYRALTESEQGTAVDIGPYLTEIAAAVVAANGTASVHLDIQVGNWPMPIDVAMSLGLVVNEVMTNSLKHAFGPHERGTISLHATHGPACCTVVVADNGCGLPEHAIWPTPGKLSSLIVHSLLQKANATFALSSSPGKGTRVSFGFPTPTAVGNSL